MKLIVQTINKIQNEFEVTNMTTISEIKSLIATNHSIDIERVCLIYKTARLSNDAQTLGDLSFVDNDKFLLIIKKPPCLISSKPIQKEQKTTVEKNSISNTTKEVNNDHNTNTGNDAFNLFEDEENKRAQYVDVEFGEDSFEEMVEEIAEVDPELAQRIREDPFELSHLLHQDLIEMGEMEEDSLDESCETTEEEEELEKLTTQLEELERERIQYERIIDKCRNGIELDSEEENLLHLIEDDDDDESSVDDISFDDIVDQLIQMGFPKYLAEEAAEQTQTLTDAVNYCLEH
ncbi:Ubiquitin-like domain-containing protein [Entamoeba marina]